MKNKIKPLLFIFLSSISVCVFSENFCIQLPENTKLVLDLTSYVTVYYKNNNTIKKIEVEYRIANTLNLEMDDYLTKEQYLNVLLLKLHLIDLELKELSVEIN